MLELVVEAGPQSGQHFSLENNAVIGRGQFADLVIADLAVSRRHAQIEVQAGDWLIKDLDSANGTRHNGKVLSAVTRLTDGDTVELGQTRLRVRLRQRLVPPDTMDIEPPEATLVDVENYGRTPFPPARSPRPIPSQRGKLPSDMDLRLRFVARLSDLFASPGVLENQLRDALAVLADVFRDVERFALLVREAPHRPWRILARRIRGGQEIDLQVAQALANSAISAGRVALASQGATLSPALPASLLARLPACAASAAIMSAGSVLGALYLDAPQNGEALHPEDADFLATCAGLFGALLAAYRHVESEKLMPAHDLEQAQRIQSRFLPSATPRFDGYEIADSYSAARIVGGDLFDFVTLADGRPALFIADVSGKGFPAALVMARVGAHVRALAPRQRSVSELLRQLDEVIARELESGMFVTALAASMDAQQGVIDIASAGHPMPLVRRSDGRVDVLPVPAASPLGVGKGSFHELRVALGRGDGMLFYTDGLDEARDADDRPFGLARVQEILLAARSAGQAIESLVSAVGQYLGDVTQYDDVAMIALWRR